MIFSREEDMKVGCLWQVLHLQVRKLLQYKVWFVGYVGTPHLHWYIFFKDPPPGR